MTMAKQAHPLGLYLHIPFCRSKCAYCDFYSLSGREDRMDAYTAALERHLIEVAPQAAQHLVDTVYFGGGTPSYLGEKRLVKLLKAVKKHYHVDPHAEITLEANPDSAGDWKALRTLRRAGFNRISLGVQSTDDACLRALGRIHTWQQVQEAVAACRRAKFPDVSLDLIYGLPGQTMEQWEKTLSDALTLQPEHLSCYGLIPEEGTPLYRDLQTGQLTLPDEDNERRMYDLTLDLLAQSGFQQYEISNFARPGCECRHNIGYWQQVPYIGLGVSAASYLPAKNGMIRLTNPRTLPAYLRMVQSQDDSLREQEFVSKTDGRFETLMLGLRMTCGISESEFQGRHGVSLDALYGEKLRKFEQEGLLQHKTDRWSLTRRGMDVQNAILVELMDD